MSETSLEQRYRSAVSWYPPRWRRQHGEAMVGVLLDVADGEGREQPAAGELLELRWQALTEWVNGVVPEPIRALSASLSMGAIAGFAVIYFFFVSWPLWSGPSSAPVGVPTFGPFLNAAPLFIGPMLVMFVAALGGSRLLTHLLGVVSVLGVGAAAFVRYSTENWNGPGSTTLAFAALLVVFSNIGHPRRRGPMLATFGFVAVATGFFAAMRLPAGRPFEVQFVGDAGWWSMGLSPWVLAGAGALVLLAAAFLFVGRQRPAAAALAIAWLPWAAAGTVTLRVFAGEDADSFVMAVGSAALAVVAVASARRQHRPTIVSSS